MRLGNIDVMQAGIKDNNDLENLKNISANETKKTNKLSKEKKESEADGVAKEFETLFLDMMMKSMRQTVKAEDETNAENIYKSMLDSEYTKVMTDAQSFGIREMVRNWITQNS